MKCSTNRTTQNICKERKYIVSEVWKTVDHLSTCQIDFPTLFLTIQDSPEHTTVNYPANPSLLTLPPFKLGVIKKTSQQ